MVIRNGLLLCLGALASYNLGQGFYISAKATLGQHLISASWREGGRTRPWPWADTWPVARLIYRNEELYVLAGSHGSALAFGPGHVDGTALPGQAGVSVVGGHRDTHFSVLRDVRVGDEFEVQGVDRRWVTYRVDHVGTVDTRTSPGIPTGETGDDRLFLVTCYPFDALVAGGPLRFIVEARKKRPVG